MGKTYRLGVFANMYPRGPGDHAGIFIKRMVDALLERGVQIDLAVKTSRSVAGYPAFLAQSTRLCLQPGVDLFQAHYIPHSSIIPALLKRKKPLIIKFHGDDARIFPFRSGIHREVIQFMLARADYVITASEEMRRILIGIGADPRRSSAISSGVDTKQFAPMLKEKCRDAFNLPLPPSLFLFIGRYHPWKGVRELVEAARHFPDDLFVFAGTGTLPDRPRNCIDIGSVPFERVPLLINAADCLILPSHTEGVPNVLMESLACGVPVVSSDVGGCPEVVTDGATGLLVPPGDVPALVRAVRWMKDHPDERVVMGQRGREDIAMRYEQRILLDRLIAIHTGLIGD